MAPNKRTPPGGIGRRSWDSVAADGFDFPRDNPNPTNSQDSIRRRGGFARGIVFAEFGSKHARALDYDGFIDRKPNQAPLWWRL